MPKNLTLLARPYGSDPYNTVDAPALQHAVVSSYHGPLTAVAYRDQYHWDFAPGVSCAAKLSHWQARHDHTLSLVRALPELPALLRRQAG
jgi:hypothetical protein